MPQPWSIALTRTISITIVVIELQSRGSERKVTRYACWPNILTLVRATQDRGSRTDVSDFVSDPMCFGWFTSDVERADSLAASVSTEPAWHREDDLSDKFDPALLRRQGEP